MLMYTRKHPHIHIYFKNIYFKNIYYEVCYARLCEGMGEGVYSYVRV